METYHKIQTLFKRHTDKPNKGKMIRGAWTTPELEYLADKEWEFTEKVDGTNIRVHIRRIEDTLFVEYGGRTDNAVLPKPLAERLRELFPESSPSRRAESNRDALIGLWMLEHDLTDVLLFGEGYGPKIQAGGGNYRSNQDFVLFDVKIGNFWLDRENVDDVARKLQIDSVPVIGYGTLYDAIEIVEGGMTSTWGDFEAEGIVARPKVPLFNRKGERIITKIKGVDFK